MGPLGTDDCNINMEDLLNFTTEDEDKHNDYQIKKTKMSLPHNNLLHPSTSSLSSPFSEDCIEEEELEWISNKDAFPMVESFVDSLPNHPSIDTTLSTTATTTTTATTNNNRNDHLSPVSVLETTTTTSTSSSGGSGVSALSGPPFKVPGKARTKQARKKRKDMVGQKWQYWVHHQNQHQHQQHHHKVKSYKIGKQSSTIGRKCLHCQAEKTPQWRAGPFGPKTLCNACGVRYKSGRLVPEYRPASSPTFSNEVHSNSHRKIMEMRKQKGGGGGGMMSELWMKKDDVG